MPLRPEDPVLKSSRREAIVALLLYAATFLYTVTYCYVNGYRRPAASLRFVLGFPDWVFWGVVVPWAACILLGVWYPYFFMKDEDLGPAEEGDGDE
jgi:hypothetical protein